MAPTRWPLVVGLLLGVVPAASAQVIVGPPPGIGFRYHGHRFSVAGFFPTGPAVPVYYPFYPPYYPPPAYGVIERHIVIQPTVVVAPPRLIPVPVPVPAPDLSGIDLDVEPPAKLFGNDPPPNVARRVELPVMPAPKKAEPPPKKPEPADDLAVPRAVPTEEAKRLIELGVREFRRRQYGTALLRFRQASAADPMNSRAYFLTAQAQLAFGQFKEAVRAIEEGLRFRPDWPTADFRPRAELYPQNENAWNEHRQRLAEAQQQRPKDADYLFLKAYLAWFDGQRPEAARWFRAARAWTTEPRWIDLFLKHAPAAVAAE